MFQILVKYPPTVTVGGLRLKTETYLVPGQTSKVQFFAKTFNGIKSLIV